MKKVAEFMKLRFKIMEKKIGSILCSETQGAYPLNVLKAGYGKADVLRLLS